MALLALLSSAYLVGNMLTPNWGLSGISYSHHRRIYTMKCDETGFKEHIAHVVIRNLLRDFPEETRGALKNMPE